jgi:hypothetical protein
MRNRILWGLVALNVLLLATLVARLGGENAAVAQAPHRPSDYIMIPGEVNGSASAIVYMIDTGAGQLGAMTYDDSRKELNTMPPIDLARVFQSGAPPANPRGAAVAPGARVPGR